MSCFYERHFTHISPPHEYGRTQVGGHGGTLVSPPHPPPRRGGKSSFRSARPMRESRGDPLVVPNDGSRQVQHANAGQRATPCSERLWRAVANCSGLEERQVREGTSLRMCAPHPAAEEILKSCSGVRHGYSCVRRTTTDPAAAAAVTADIRASGRPILRSFSASRRSC